MDDIIRQLTRGRFCIAERENNNSMW